MFKKSKLDKILKRINENKYKYFLGELNNIVFLDFDGVLNLDTSNYCKPFDNKELMENLNKLCVEYNFCIVVISSWRKYTDYKDILYKSGLNEKIKILGCTNTLEKDRESEIIDYLENNEKINKFIILDDGIFNELSMYQIKTEGSVGFNKEKYIEAVNLINRI